MNLAGYANRVARVDLSSSKVAYEAINEDDARKYIGARGLGVKYLLDHGPERDPLSEDNLLAVMTGPLSGTDVKMSGRLAVVTKSPLTGTVTDSHMGGWTAAKLKWAGFDGLLFTGKAAKPSYALVQDGDLSLHEAPELWGKDTFETIAALREKHGAKAAVMCIGQAGENLVKFASIMNEDQRSAGRGGTGCVMGSKNLKAIVILGEFKSRPKPMHKEAFKAADKRALATLMDEGNITAPKKGSLSVYGTNVLMNVTNTMGALPAKNGLHTNFADAEFVSGEHIRETILVSEPTCHACPVACKKEVEFTYKGQTIRTESYEYETAWALGPNCFHGDRDAVGYMMYLCNKYGMDTIETGNACSVFMEASDCSYLNGNAAEALAWGDADAQVELVKKIALRQGVGDKLAEGPAHFAAAVGHPEISMTVKGQGIPAYDPRGLKGMGIGYATSNRGACHLRAYTPASEILGIGGKTDPIAWQGKGDLTKLLQDLHAFSDSLDLCKFSAFAEGPQEYADQYATFVGIDNFGPDEVLSVGERIYNLERYYNNLAGFREGSDYLPTRFTSSPSDSQGSEGQVAEIDAMLEEYYRARGWENGVVPESKLRELGIL